MVFKLWSGNHREFCNINPSSLQTLQVYLKNLYYLISDRTSNSSFEYTSMKIQLKQPPLPKFGLRMASYYPLLSKCCCLLQQYIYTKQHLQHLPIRWPNTDLDLCQVNCMYLCKKNITKNWQFMPNKGSISLSLNIFSQCKYWMWFSLNIFDRLHFYLNDVSQDFIFIYMGVQKIHPWNIKGLSSKMF